MTSDKIRAAPGEAHAVNDGFFCGDAENARLGVPSLGEGCDRPHFDMPEPQRCQTPPGQAILIVSGGQSHMIGKG